ncbi:MAG: YabP/YqfC family sporulation protein, partial [Clostridium sp.]|nr:YabP/YqfC family sporulation protein [Clostridium sp.]
MEEERKSSLSLEDRKKLTLSGVLEVVNFDDEKISLNTILG